MADVDMSPPVHEPQHNAPRPKGILKNPSFQGHEKQEVPEQEHATTPLSAPMSAQEEKELTIQNTIQNAGPRRSSSAARRSSGSRRHSSAAGLRAAGDDEDDAEKMRLKWDEANLYLAEQEAGGRMKITEPKTPFEYGNAMEEVDEEEDVAIDPRYINIDEVEMKNKKTGKKARDSEIPGLELGEAEDDTAGPGLQSDRIVQEPGLSREASRDKHVSVDNEGKPDMPDEIEDEKHRQFEAQRRKHYEMSNVKDMLGNPEYLDEDDDTPMSQSSSRRGPNGTI